MPADLLDKAQTVMVRGDAKQADKLFKQLEDQAQWAINAAAEAAFQRCQIARANIRYQEALSHCKRAQQLVPDNTAYLLGVADLAWKSGQYRLARDIYEQVPTSVLKTQGEEHPSVAILRHNLGEIWNSLGEYRKAIGYYKQALKSAVEKLGLDHTMTKQIREHLAEAAKGEKSETE